MANIEYKPGKVDTGKVLSTAIRNRDFWRLYILAVLMVFCSIFYYFGEIVDLVGWDSTRWSFFYGVHDIHRLLFLIPIVYTGYIFGARAVVLVTIVVVGIFMPRALFISPFEHPILRPLFFILIAGTLGYLASLVRVRMKRRGYLESRMRREIDRLSALSDRIEEGILIIGPDYRIRYFNNSMQRNFGEVTSPYCYTYLRGLDVPCGEVCKLSEVLAGAVRRWQYELPDGRVFEVLASPYIDTDGAACQYATFRDTMVQEERGKRVSEQQD